ncbi:YceD family protein [Novosphingobium sp.]|uniref:YceD family protein n=1 Tax=Novosphingobium sp. TaxID=1874826 RepID=UPI003B52A724
MSAHPAMEFSRIIDIRHLPPTAVEITPDESERRRLAARFTLSAIERMVATVEMIADGTTINVKGRIRAAIIQACAISGEDFPVRIDEPVDLRFVHSQAAQAAGDDEIELTADDCDEIEYEGLTFDLGEALAQTLALAIDPFAEGPDADRARAEHKLGGEASGGAFDALAALRPGSDNDGD